MEHFFSGKQYDLVRKAVRLVLKFTGEIHDRRMAGLVAMMERMLRLRTFPNIRLSKTGKGMRRASHSIGIRAADDHGHTQQAQLTPTDGALLFDRAFSARREINMRGRL